MCERSATPVQSAVSEDRAETTKCFVFGGNRTEDLLRSSESSTQVWDLGDPGSTPIQLSEISLDRPHLNLIDIRRWSRGSLVRIEDSVTKKDVFQLCGKYTNPSAIQWDGWYLIAGYRSGEVLILDFSQMLASGDL